MQKAFSMKKILLIEDCKSLRENTAEILEIGNYQVITAEGGKTGVELALKENPDLIICDIMMPDLDGYGVLYLLKRNPLTRNKPFIFITAKTGYGDLRKGMELGADDYITKPFSALELLCAIEARFKKTGTHKQPVVPGQTGTEELTISGDGGQLLKTLLDRSKIVFYREKEEVYCVENFPHALYFVKKGKVKTVVTSPDGKELVVGLYNADDFFGYKSLFSRTRYKDTAVVMEDAEIIEIPERDFELLVIRNHKISEKFIRLLAENVTEKEDQLVKMAYNSLRKKVADALLALHKKFNPGKENARPINITRENLASLAGTATESLRRTLADFRDEKLIGLGVHGIIILNEKKLETLGD